MRLAHPNTNETITVKSNSKIYYQLRREGWKDVTPPRSEKQHIQAEFFKLLGTTTRTRANIMYCVQKIQLSQEAKNTLCAAANELLKKEIEIRARLKQMKEGG